jgi:GUN4-like
MSNLNQFDTVENQLAEIHKQLNELKHQLSEVQKQVSQNLNISQKESQIANGKKQVEGDSELSVKLSEIESNLLLVSDILRYEQLRNYLAAGNWFEADKETIRLIADIAGHSDLEEFRPDDVRHFPCVHLQVIDRLWLNYSQGHFGFSIQAQIYQEVGGDIETTIEQNAGLIVKWGDRLGWRAGNRWKKCDELDYSLNAPFGCHPSRWWNSPFGSKMTNYFLSRLIICQI